MKKIVFMFALFASLQTFPKNGSVLSPSEASLRENLLEYAFDEDPDDEVDPGYRPRTTEEVVDEIRKICDESGLEKQQIYDIARTVVDQLEAEVKKGTVYYAHNVSSMLGFIGISCGRMALPFFEEKGLSSDTHESIRMAAANQYINLASLDESIGFMEKILGINHDKGAWRFTITPMILGKIEAAINAGELSGAEKERVLSVLLSYMRSPASSWEASKVDAFLAKHCDGYLTSVQRMSMARDISDAGNERERKHFLPIRESIEALPKKQRVDLRERFPDLPPLPADKEGCPSVPVWIVVGVAVVIGVAAFLRFLLWKRRAAP